MIQFADSYREPGTLKIAFLSAGLGNVARGFEISAYTWFEEIKKKDNITARLFSGGKFKTATLIWNCPRNGYMAALLRSVRLIKDGCRLEQITFSLGFLLHLIFYRPNIIWLQEATLANMLLKFRKVFGCKYELMFCDGAPVGYAYAKRFDYLIFLHQDAMNEAIRDGGDPQKCRVIPHLSLFPHKQFNKVQARARLHIDNNKFVIICVAAWNNHHKRIGYLLDEIAYLDLKEVTLLLCGQPEQEFPFLKDTATKLHIDVQWHTFSQQDLSTAYVASDLFVLPRLDEALGVVLIEAGAHGLPVICHDHRAGRYIFGADYKGLTDLSEKGNLSKKITALREIDDLEKEGFKTAETIAQKFNRQKLTTDFVDFVGSIVPN